jgi:hypothetical protein
MCNSMMAAWSNRIDFVGSMYRPDHLPLTVLMGFILASVYFIKPHLT